VKKEIVLTFGLALDDAAPKLMVLGADHSDS
jgi:hypothetical protein